METTLKSFLRDFAQDEYRVGRDKLTREELLQYISRDMDEADEVYIDARHDGSLIVIAGADSHPTSKIRVINGLKGHDETTVDALAEIRTDEEGVTTAVTRSGRQIVVAPEWDVWSDFAGGFDGWYGVNVEMDGNSYTYCPDWAGDDGNELRIVDIVRHGFFAACMRDDYEPGEYKTVDEYLCSGWPWCVIQGWFDEALTDALEAAKSAYDKDCAEIMEGAADDDD